MSWIEGAFSSESASDSIDYNVYDSDKSGSQFPPRTADNVDASGTEPDDVRLCGSGEHIGKERGPGGTLVRLYPSLKIQQKYTGEPGASRKRPRAEDINGRTWFRDLMKGRARRLAKLMDRLSKTQRQWVREVGFGGMLEMHIPILPTAMNEWLVNSFSPPSHLFSICGEPKFFFNPVDVEDIFSLPHHPSRPVIGNSCDPDVRNLLVQWEHSYNIKARQGKITLKSLRGVIRKLTDGGDDFVRMFILYVLHSLLTPVADKHVPIGALKALLCVDDICELDWAGYVFRHLCDGVELYKDGTVQYGCEGCVFALLIAYLQKSTWKGKRPPSFSPTVQNWPSAMILSRISEEKRCGKYGTAVIDRAHLLGICDEESDDRDGQPISFMVEYPLPLDRCLETMFHLGDEVDVARLCRDFNAVLIHHVRNSPYLRGLVQSKGRISTDCINNPHLACDYVDEFMSNFELVRANFNYNCPDLNEMANFDKVTETRTTGARPGSYPAWNTWRENNLFAFDSQLCTRLIICQSKPPQHEMEIVDYCLGVHSSFMPTESLYADGFYEANRTEVHTFERDISLCPKVFSALVHLLNRDWTDRGVRCASLELMVQPAVEFDELELDISFLGITTPAIDNLWKAEIIFLPICVDGKYSTVALNFRSRKIHFMICGYQESQADWEKFAKNMGMCALTMLRLNGDLRIPESPDFTFDVLSSPACTSRSHVESGVEVIRMMECFRGHPDDVRQLGLESEVGRLRLRLEYCARLILSPLNRRKAVLLRKVEKNIDRKLDDACPVEKVA